MVKMKSLIVDFDKDILRIDGADITTPTVVNIPDKDGWKNRKLFNTDVDLLKQGVKPDVLDIEYNKKD